ncbi:archaellin/type IV pilin N-terminal domain-containing protein [archaeon]
MALGVFMVSHKKKDLKKEEETKGISPIVAVVLLIAIAVIAAVAISFWSGGLVTSQSTPDKPNVITASILNPTSGWIGIANLGPGPVTLNYLNTTDGTTCNFNGTVTIAEGQQDICVMPPKIGISTLYSPTTGSTIVQIGGNELTVFSWSVDMTGESGVWNPAFQGVFGGTGLGSIVLDDGGAVGTFLQDGENFDEPMDVTMVYINADYPSETDQIEFTLKASNVGTEGPWTDYGPWTETGIASDFVVTEGLPEDMQYFAYEVQLSTENPGIGAGPVLNSIMVAFQSDATAESYLTYTINNPAGIAFLDVYEDCTGGQGEPELIESHADLGGVPFFTNIIDYTNGCDYEITGEDPNGNELDTDDSSWSTGFPPTADEEPEAPGAVCENEVIEDGEDCDPSVECCSDCTFDAAMTPCVENPEWDSPQCDGFGSCLCIESGTTEFTPFCDDGFDNDCSGLWDCDDENCAGDAACIVPAPENDDCAGMIAVTDETVPFSTISSTTDGTATDGCPGQVFNDIWYIYTATCDGTFTASTCNDADFDTAIVIYTGSDCQSKSENTCNNDEDGCGVTSTVTWEVTTGTDYIIRLGSLVDATTGTGNIAFSCEVAETCESCIDGGGLWIDDEYCDTEYLDCAAACADAGTCWETYEGACGEPTCEPEEPEPNTLGFLACVNANNPAGAPAACAAGPKDAACLAFDTNTVGGGPGADGHISQADYNSGDPSFQGCYSEFLPGCEVFDVDSDAQNGIADGVVNEYDFFLGWAITDPGQWDVDDGTGNGVQDEAIDFADFGYCLQAWGDADEDGIGDGVDQCAGFADCADADLDAIPDDCEAVTATCLTATGCTAFGPATVLMAQGIDCGSFPECTAATCNADANEICDVIDNVGYHCLNSDGGPDVQGCISDNDVAMFGFGITNSGPPFGTIGECLTYCVWDGGDCTTTCGMPAYGAECFEDAGQFQCRCTCPV